MAYGGFSSHFGFQNKPILDDLEGVTCSICLEIYHNPVLISCGHIFCSSCLDPYSHLAEPQCPLCRLVFDPKKQAKASDVEKRISSHKTVCKQCKTKVTVSKLRSHLPTCSAVTGNRPEPFQPASPTGQPLPVDVPNRSTFQCPYCGVANLTSNDLLTHCNELHKDSHAKVVCPICSSMPWGIQDMKSSNFISHLNLRHKFEYDTYVDFDKDDDAMLQAALKASMDHT
ncbi:E3 ubiquitin-protein ligase RNF166-like [Lineus longissimus]|uniref:E3 ubiquitin-protein ligase RNF166-like n=1 Tax=Lineus longissimus TaxID=88925 RepID=UPI002B4F2A91